MRLTRSFFLATLLVVWALQPASAQSDLSDKLSAVERAVDKKREELHIPGVSLAIVKDDKVIYVKGLGVRNVEENLPVTPKTQFAIGSSSKAFTAMTVMMSADEGKLLLTDSPKKSLPYFKISDPEIDAKITVSDILSHRSGLERTDMAWYTGKLSPREIILAAGDAKPTAKLGEKFQYQNVMFLAAGEVVSAVQKKPWRQFLAERIFKPLGMKTSNTDILDMQRQPDFAFGYAWVAEKKSYQRLPARQIRNIAPAGAINSNAEEMAQWVRLMTNGGTFEGKRLVNEKSFAELTVPRISMGGKASYGYGWMLREWNGHKVVEHGGNIDGFNAQVAYMPDQKLGFVLLTNVSASPLGSYTMTTVWEQLVGPVPTVAKETTNKDAATGASSTVGTVVAPDKEVGKYKIAGAPVSFDIAMKDGGLVFSVPGQPPYPLLSLGGRRYKLGSPAPDGFFATFRPSKQKPELTELFVEQPQGNVVALRDDSKYDAPISVEELMRKAVEARGGEANLRKHSSITMRYEVKWETQGVSGFGVEHWRNGSHADELTMTAAGKKIATVRDCFDGKTGSTEVSFATSDAKTGKALANAVAEASFVQELDWKKLFSSVKIVRLDKVDGEECYVVEKIVNKGDPYYAYYSTKSFLPLKLEGPGGAFETYQDYADEGGIKVSHKLVRSGGIGGAAKVTIKEVRFDARIADGAFRPRLPAPAAERPSETWATLSVNE